MKLEALVLGFTKIGEEQRRLLLMSLLQMLRKFATNKTFSLEGSQFVCYIQLSLRMQPDSSLGKL
jgi:hypothetical protein